MPSGEYNLIREAIIHKHQVFATYKGHFREMCPHTLGLKNGREQALFVQFGGSSESRGTIGRDNPIWVCARVDGLSNVGARMGDWHTIDIHTQDQTCVDEIDVEAEH